jgi:adenylate cyclase
VQRKLAAILAADVVSYSRLVRADEVGTLAAMKALWSEVVQPSVRSHRGRVFKLMGDGMLAVFASVVDAASAAEAIQTAANERASGEAEDKAIRLRIGINLGDVVVDGSDLYGDGVNIAARVQEVAEPGGIAVSAATHEYLRGKTSITFTDAGDRSLKNIDDTVRVWLWPSAGETLPAGVSTSNRTSQPSMAVLPFKNLSSAADAEFFADGMTEDVINALSKFRWLFVIGRGTMFTYKGRAVGAVETALDLGVRFVLEGSVRQAGQRLRVSVQLTDTKSGNAIWTQRYDRQLDDIFAIQDEITNAIAAAIAPEIERLERRRAAAAPPTEVDTWLLYQKGVSAFMEAVEQGLEASLTYFDEVNLRDPNFAPALALGAFARMSLANVYRGDELEQLSHVAKQKAELAYSLDPADPLTLLALARTHSGLGNHREALALAWQAVEANPNNAFSRDRLAQIAVAAGHFDLCIEQCNIMLALSPLDPRESLVKGIKGVAHFLKGEYQNAIDTIQSMTSPKLVSLNLKCVEPMSLFKLGREDEARAAIKKILANYPKLSVAFFQRGSGNYVKTVVDPFVAGLRELGVPEE